MGKFSAVISGPKWTSACYWNTTTNRTGWIEHISRSRASSGGVASTGCPLTSTAGLRILRAVLAPRSTRNGKSCGTCSNAYPTTSAKCHVSICPAAILCQRAVPDCDTTAAAAPTVHANACHHHDALTASTSSVPSTRHWYAGGTACPATRSGWAASPSASPPDTPPATSGAG